MGHGIIRNKKAVFIGVAVLRAAVSCGRRLFGGFFKSFGIAVKHIGVDCSRIGKRNIMQGTVGQAAVYRARNLR